MSADDETVELMGELRSDTRQFLEVRPATDPDWPDAHRLWLVVGGQSFSIGAMPAETKVEAEWYAEQFAHALAAMCLGITVKRMADGGYDASEDDE